MKTAMSSAGRALSDELRTVGGKREAGFTLLEIILVIAIIALVAALVAPRLNRGLGGVKTRTAASTIAATMKRAKGLALRARSKCTVNFTDSNRMLVGCAGSRTEAREIRLDEGVQVDSDNGRSVDFFPGGSSSGGSFEVKGPDGSNAYTVMIEPSTGHVKVRASETP